MRSTNHVTGPSWLLDPHYPMDDICSVRTGTLPRLRTRSGWWFPGTAQAGRRMIASRTSNTPRTEMPTSRNGILTSHTMGYKMRASRAAASKHRQQQPGKSFALSPVLLSTSTFRAQAASQPSLLLEGGFPPMRLVDPLSPGPFPLECLSLLALE